MDFHCCIYKEICPLKELLNELQEMSYDAFYDLELLLYDDELLYIECLAPGSWYVTLWSKVRVSYHSILQTIAVQDTTNSVITSNKIMTLDG